MKHLTGKRLLPKIFKDQNHIDEIKGVYVPFWLFDTDVDAKVRYKATKIRTWVTVITIIPRPVIIWCTEAEVLDLNTFR